MRKKQLSFAVLAGFIVVSGGSGSAFARTPGAPLHPGFNMFSKQQDVQLGQEAAAQVRAKAVVVPNQFLQDYVNRIGQRLAAAPEARSSGFPFSFTVIADPSINAFALPGGPMFIHTGLLKAVDNEGELAGVMGHEMSHVILRHGTNQASKANLIQIPAMLAGAVGGHSMLGQLAQAGVGLGANSVLLKFSRTDETEADAMGSHLMSEAGYNPLEMAHFFEKLSASGGARGPQFLSDHPNPGNREQAIEAEIRTLPQRNYGSGTGEFGRMKQLLGQVSTSAPGSAFRGGNVAPNGQPTGGFKQIQSRNFTLDYPGNWQAYGSKDSDSVTIAPRDGLVQASNGSTQVGYGAIVSYFQNEGNNGDVNQSTDELIHHLHANNPSMEISRNRKQVAVGRYQGLITMLQSNSPYGDIESDALLTVATPQGLFYMIFIAPQNQFANLKGTFEQMIQSIRFTS